MASRIIAQMLLMGAGMLGRAMVQAYQQAIVNSARSGAGGAAAARSVRGRIGVQEASEVLGVEPNAGLKDIYNKYDKLFAANDPKQGGSLYLQAKIHHAKVELEKAAVERGEQPRVEQQEQQTPQNPTQKP